MLFDLYTIKDKLTARYKEYLDGDLLEISNVGEKTSMEKYCRRCIESYSSITKGTFSIGAGFNFGNELKYLGLTGGSYLHFTKHAVLINEGDVIEACRKGKSVMACYGVCDDVAQVYKKYPILKNDKKNAYCVSFCKIERKEQPSDGGWRWHKWGEYIGKHKITTEYLHDEKKIDFVYVYHIHLIKEA